MVPGSTDIFTSIDPALRSTRLDSEETFSGNSERLVNFSTTETTTTSTVKHTQVSNSTSAADSNSGQLSKLQKNRVNVDLTVHEIELDVKRLDLSSNKKSELSKAAASATAAATSAHAHE